MEVQIFTGVVPNATMFTSISFFEWLVIGPMFPFAKWLLMNEIIVVIQKSINGKGEVFFNEVIGRLKKF